MIIFAYRLAWDTGFAPCLDHNVFTLACCKGGQIRKGKNIFTGLRYQIGQYHGKNPEDEIYLLGIYKDHLLYYAMITDIMLMTEYFSQKGKMEFGRRTDQIYDVRDDMLVRNDALPHIHPKGEAQIRQDRNGVYVLISKSFTYFGTNAPVISGEMINLLPKNRECKRYAGSSPEGMKIHEYAMRTIGSFGGVAGIPHDRLYD